MGLDSNPIFHFRNLDIISDTTRALSKVGLNLYAKEKKERTIF